MMVIVGEVVRDARMALEDGGNPVRIVENVGTIRRG
jgi:hypothetical protein